MAFITWFSIGPTTRILLRLIGSLLLAFSLLILMIRAQPYDDSALRAFLAPADCAKPCLAGIRPGYTQRESVPPLLESHGPITDVQHSQYITTWRWQAPQPPIGNDFQTLVYRPDYHVQHVTASLDTTLGAITLLLGPPDARYYPGTNYWFGVADIYEDEQLIVIFEEACPFPVSQRYFMDEGLVIAAADDQFDMTADIIASHTAYTCP